MNEQHGERIRALEIQVGHLTVGQEEMRRDLKAILEAVSQARGGWRTLLGLLALAGTIGALFDRFAPVLLGLGRP